MMRKLLNEPRAVIPLAVVVLLWVLFRYEVLGPVPLDMFNSGRNGSVQFSVKKYNRETVENDRVLKSLIKEQWLPRSWQRYSVIQHEPFVAGYAFEEVEKLEPAFMTEAAADVLLPPQTAADLALYIVENLGLDAEGFFVRFGSQRIRAGEMLGGQIISQISVPGPREVAVETIERFVLQLRLEATSTQSIPRSAQISGSYYFEGNIVSRLPLLALLSVGQNRVELIDREGRVWTLILDD
jgi:hypothetical protein